jgi:molybdopterin/thiamine biosynthesis adenylyltransferase
VNEPGGRIRLWIQKKKVNSQMQTNMHKLLHVKSKKITDPAGREVEILEDIQASSIADACQCTVHDIYSEALKLGICPYRYLRNREAISLREQLRLAKSRVAVVGVGGLGGHVILLLSRLGIGTLVVVDYDVFDETNLNRQALSNMETLGKPKPEAAVATVSSINPGVKVIPCQVRLDSSNAPEILTGSNVVVDALDNVQDRFLLEQTAKKLEIPLVHGALAGFEGQVMTIFPEDPGLKHLYRNEGASGDKSKSPESVLGVPTLTPSLIATLEAMEVVKIILKKGKTFRNTMAHVDLETGQINEFTFEKK